MNKLIKILNQSQYVLYTLPFFSDPLSSIHFQKKLKNHHFIFLDPHPFFKKMRQSGLSVFCLKEKNPLVNINKNSAALLSHPLTQEFIQKTKGKKIPAIFYFKPQARLDHLIKKNGWKAINNPAALQRELENKFNLLKICQKLDINHPPSKIITLNQKSLVKNFGSNPYPLVVQSAHGWAGNNTYLIKTKKDPLKHPFLNQKVKISQYIPGLTLINNAVATKQGTLQSPVAIQFTGLSKLTSTSLGTCGRQWPAPVSQKTKNEIMLITKKIGDYLYQIGYKGFFGLDFQLSKNKKVYLIEINPRLTASFSFYTHLELLKGLTPILLYHLFEHLDLPYTIDPKKELLRTKNKTITGSELSQKLLFTNSKTITQSPPSGIYDFSGRKTNTLNSNWLRNLKRTLKKENYLVISRFKNQKISPNSEYLKITKLATFYSQKNKKIKTIPLKLNQSLNEKFRFQKA